MAEHRIVSLIASATEIVAALGFEEQLVGRSHECDFPPSVDSPWWNPASYRERRGARLTRREEGAYWAYATDEQRRQAGCIAARMQRGLSPRAVERLPVCSAAKVDAGAPSRAIDAQVRAIVADALSVHHVNASLLDRLAPTVIVTQAQCEVCAVSLADVERAVGDLVASRPAIVSLEPMALGDVRRDVKTVAAAPDAPDRGVDLVARLTARLDAIRAAAAARPARPSIACIEWIDPLMHAGNWMPELVEIAGGVVMIGEAGRHSGYLDVEELAARDPDVVAIMPCAARGGTPRRTESGEAPG